MKKVDVHIHTFRSPCGKNEMLIDSIARKATGLGLDYIGISDHIHTDTRVREQFEDTLREIRAVNPDIKIYMGCELDVIKPGESTINDYLREHCDYIGVGANHYFCPGVELPPQNGTLRELAEHYVKMHKYAASMDDADFITHPFFVFGHHSLPISLTSEIDDDEIVEIIETAKEHNTAFELTPRMYIGDNRYFMSKFYFMCKELGAKFSVGTDSHELRTMDALPLLDNIIRELNLTDDDMWYTAKFK
ncbi:MAG: PHP domain-containing protein [Abditibacteriota bacterium]|nr:PHP domain-containing protein [Abditibacteriota bacterium]MBP5094111.1 PHP domain-containing protein [Abditibacteriota bacterium]MBP5718779.1 PHP domain-containing protein [Abditibacteriota bacterium]